MPAGGVTCGACGVENRPGAKFCDDCGGRLSGARSDDRRSRKIVTIVFADLAGSTSLQERMDPESARSVMDRFYRLMSGAVVEQDGAVVKVMGDGVMAVFGVPQTREDDALRAVRAAAAMHDAFALLGLENVGLRVGVNTGEVVVSDDDDDVVGDAVNVAARLEHAAGEGQVLVGESTWRLIRDSLQLEAVPPLQLKGKGELVPAYRLVSLTPAEPSLATPFVGRAAELGRLVAALDGARTTQAPRLEVVIGSPGLGKSRLAAELCAAARTAGAAVYEARCDATSTSAFAPLTETIVALMPPVADDRVVRVGQSLLGIGSPATPEETSWGVRRLLEIAATTAPVVLVIDDVHWAEPLLLDLIDHVVEWAVGSPILVVLLARPEIRDVRPALAARDPIVLGGLEAAASVALAGRLLGSDLPEELAARLLATSDGNPLFLRELVRMLTDDGWTVAAGIDQIDVPPTIHALLAARIEQLGSDERTVIERAAVVGNGFHRVAVAELLRSPAAAVDRHIDALCRRELVEPDGTFWLDEPVFRFHHALIRDAAYRRLLKEVRAELHERFASWLEANVDILVGEHDEVLGYHLEQAHENRRQVGALGDGGGELGRRASTHLARAARRALERDDMSAAATLSGRALDVLPAGPDNVGARSAVLLDRCEALLATAAAAPAAVAVADLCTVAEGDRRLMAWADCFAAELRMLTEAAAMRDVEASLAAAAATLDGLGDAAGAAKAYAVHARVLARLGRMAACEATLDLSLGAARAAADRRRANAVLSAAPVAALWGPSPVARASGRCLDVVRVLRITTGAPAVEAAALRAQAVLEALRERFDAARDLLAQSRRTVEELGLRHAMLDTDAHAGIVELLAHRHDAAAILLQRAHDGFRSLGASTDQAQAGANLARCLLELGRNEEAEALTIECERLGGDDLKTCIAWRAVRAQALARRGAVDEGLALAREGVALAAPTDALVDHADARRALSIVLRAAGRTAEADAEADLAAALLSRKRGTSDASTSVEPRGGLRTIQPEECEVALRVVGRWRDAFVAEDWDALGRCYAEDLELTDRRSGLQSSITGRAAFIEGLRHLYGGKNLDWDVDILAMTSARVGLTRIRSFSAELDRSYLGLGVLNDRDEYQLLELFDQQDLPLAFARLDELSGEEGSSPQASRRLLSQGGNEEWLLIRSDVAVVRVPSEQILVGFVAGGSVVRTATFGPDEHDAALALAFGTSARGLVHRIMATHNARDWQGYIDLLADDLVVEDRRTLQGWSTKTNRSDFVTRTQSGPMVASDVRAGVGRWLLERPDAVIFLHTMRGHGDGSDGGTVAMDRLTVAFAQGGHIRRLVFFDAGDEDAAFAEVNEHFASSLPPAAAAAWAAVVATIDSYNRSAWAEYEAMLSSAGDVVDHRTLGFGAVPLPEWVDAARSLDLLMPGRRMRISGVHRFDARGGVFSVAVRGADAKGSTSEYRAQILTTFDHAGVATAFELFDEEARGAAVARLETLRSGPDGPHKP